MRGEAQDTAHRLPLVVPCVARISLSSASTPELSCAVSCASLPSTPSLLRRGVQAGSHVPHALVLLARALNSRGIRRGQGAPRHKTIIIIERRVVIRRGARDCEGRVANSESHPSALGAAQQSREQYECPAASQRSGAGGGFRARAHCTCIGRRRGRECHRRAPSSPLLSRRIQHRHRLRALYMSHVCVCPIGA